MVEYSGGLDEAGRGPVIGPLIVCGASFSQSSLLPLKQAGVRDSKTLSPHQRIRLAAFIEGQAHQIVIKEIDASTIDAQRRRGVSLNEIEYEVFEATLGELEGDLFYVDSLDVLPQRLAARLATQNPLKRMVVEHKADASYIECAAASIIAKVRRDAAIRALAAKYGDLGTGYPSDPVTRKFLWEWIASHPAFPTFVRSTWSTCQELLLKKQTMSLTDRFED